MGDNDMKLDEDESDTNCKLYTNLTFRFNQSNSIQMIYQHMMHFTQTQSLHKVLQVSKRLLISKTLIENIYLIEMETDDASYNTSQLSTSLLDKTYSDDDFIHGIRVFISSSVICIFNPFRSNIL
jgi:hypothetical protein